VLRHATYCNTGHALALIDELMTTTGKEVAPAEEIVRAGDGFRLRGLEERVCLKCGERDGLWIAEVKSESEVPLDGLALNQCIGMTSTGRG
jgi:hypothetical protein